MLVYGKYKYLQLAGALLLVYLGISALGVLFN